MNAFREHMRKNYRMIKEDQHNEWDIDSLILHSVSPEQRLDLEPNLKRYATDKFWNDVARNGEEFTGDYMDSKGCPLYAEQPAIAEAIMFRENLAPNETFRGLPYAFWQNLTQPLRRPI